ncbi:MAG: MFS transporter [Actinobacteria bacterium]|nr:MFS transporter [Actinomycetota bacterium]
MSGGFVDAPPSSGAGPLVGRRLRPLLVGMGLQNLLLWVPVEKMFMTEIGINAATIGLLAAVYAGVVPLLEVPFGILADRWSRSGMLILGTLALAACSLVGGLSTGPLSYAGAAALLGVYFALSSGTADSIVYDTLVEQTGNSEGYERWIGRLHAVEALALVVSAVGGGVLAAVTSARFTYFATVPLIGSAVVAFAFCREPRLHRAGERVSYREQAVATMRALAGGRRVAEVVLLVALMAAASQVVFEFGPLWLVALDAPAALYGPYWALLVGTVGVGAWAASRAQLHRVGRAVAVGSVLVLAAVVPAVSRSLTLIIVAQVLVALAAAMIAVRAGFLLHEAVAATVRAGVSSGASTLSWLVFLPVSLVFGWLARAHGVMTADWLVGVIAAAVAVLLIRTARPDRSSPAATIPPSELAVAPPAPADFVSAPYGYGGFEPSA